MNDTNHYRADSLGLVAETQIPASPDMVKIVLGPFRLDEHPKFQTQREGEDPPGSLIRNFDRILDNDYFKIVHQFQNFGNTPVTVRIRRIE